MLSLVSGIMFARCVPMAALLAGDGISTAKPLPRRASASPSGELRLGVDGAGNGIRLYFSYYTQLSSHTAHNFL